MTSEVIAAAAKVMSDEELSRVALAIFNPLPGDGVTVGAPGHFGSRIQPNSPGDNEQEILFSILEGLSYGCGDVIIGLNPRAMTSTRSSELERLLADVVAPPASPDEILRALRPRRNSTPARRAVHVDVGFQSLAGTSKALAGMVGLDATACSISRGTSTGCTSRPARDRPSPTERPRASTW